MTRWPTCRHCGAQITFGDHCHDQSAPFNCTGSRPGDCYQRQINGLVATCDTLRAALRRQAVPSADDSHCLCRADIYQLEQENDKLRAALTDEGHNPTNMQMWVRRALAADDAIAAVEAKNGLWRIDSEILNDLVKSQDQKIAALQNFAIACVQMWRDR